MQPILVVMPHDTSVKLKLNYDLSNAEHIRRFDAVLCCWNVIFCINFSIAKSHSGSQLVVNRGSLL